MDNFYNSNSEDFTFFDFDARSGRTSTERAITLDATRKSSYYACLTNCVSREIRDKDLRFVRVRKDNITGDVALVFNRERGLHLQDCLFKKGKISEKLRINSADFVRCVIRLMGDGDTTKASYTLSDDLSNSAQYATYKLSKRV